MAATSPGMMRAAVLSNRNAGHDEARRKRLRKIAQSAGIPFYETGSVAEAETTLKTLADNGISLLIVHGGDGTFDTALSIIRNRNMFAEEPAFALLRGGTTNMTHEDIGMKGRADKALRRLTSRMPGLPAPLTRACLEVQAPEHDEPVYGFFFAAGAIPKAITYTRQTFHKRGLTSRLGDTMTVLAMLYRLARGKITHDPVLAPEDITLSQDGRNLQNRHVFTFATTLRRLILNITPPAPEAGFVTASLDYPYKKLIPALPSFWHGKTRTPLVYETHSRDIEIISPSPCILDGAFFVAPENKPLRVRAAKPVRYIKL